MTNSRTEDSSVAPRAPDTVGSKTDEIPVELSTRFLKHFSEILYSSPQKAFEELISNSWDAGADCVDVRISTDLTREDATMCVLDNGASMDVAGLKLLWTIASSPKTDKTKLYGRPVIGKFGIGKLATYILANKLTYICKAEDGIIRRVTMDYTALDQGSHKEQEKLMSQVSLPLYEVDESQIEGALQNVSDGSELLDLIHRGVPRPAGELIEDEFCASKTELAKPSANTWTLVVLSDLKPTGRELKIGILRRMLRASLPIGSEMAICLNGEPLSSSKLDRETLAEWTIGPELGIQSVKIAEKDKEDDTATQNSSEIPVIDKSDDTEIPVKSTDGTSPHIEIAGIGKITGQVRLFRESISGGRSDEHGASNGFHVNVLGRVVNQRDISFGETDLNHAAWARFRMTVRADGLNKYLTTNREQFTESRETKIFRAFLRTIFNKIRAHYDADEGAGLPHGGDILVKSLGVVSLNPLRNIVAETLSSQSPLPGLFDESGIEDRQKRYQEWRENTAENIGNALGEVKYEKLRDDSFVKYRLADRAMVVNRDHPFVLEHSRSKAEKELLRTVAMVSFLTDMYMLDVGINPDVLENIRDYRDRLMRFKALQRRQSGIHIAKLLRTVQHDSENSRKLEQVLSDALRHIGFEVQDLAQSGQPEGIASAYPYPTKPATKEDEAPPLYKFTFDAKSSKHSTAKTGNIDLAAMRDHKNKHDADYALVVAPGYTGKAIADRCDDLHITPITASDLGTLLEYTVRYGAIDLTKLRELFSFYRPDRVSKWVKELELWIQEKRSLTIQVFMSALEHLKGDVPAALPAATLTYICKKVLKIRVADEDVLALARGLAILLPDLVGVENDKIVVNASPQRVTEAIRLQLENLQDDESLVDNI